MADATKHLSISGATVVTDVKSLFSVIKTRRTVAFAYGFMFAFVAFTVFLAFSPSSNSSPWFTSIFSTSTSTASVSSTDYYRSQFPSIFNHLFPNDTSSQEQQAQQIRDTSFSLPSEANTARSNNTVSQSPSAIDQQPTSKNQTHGTEISDKATVLKANLTTNTSPPNVNSKPPPNVNNHTQKAGDSVKPQLPKANRTTFVTPETHVPENQSVNSPSNSGSSGKESTGTGKPVVPVKGGSNYTASPLKKHNNVTQHANGTGSGVSGKPGKENWMQSLANCDLFDGEWVKDDSYPLYKPGSCSLIDEQFDCILNGRPDKGYQKFKWKPKGCSLPRLNGAHMLELLRGKRLVLVGDSLNRNMWESLVCILRNSVKNVKRVYEAYGRQHFRGEASYSFIFKDYNCSVEFFVSPFLVQEWEMPDKNGTPKETLRLDLVGRSSDQYKTADIIVFNTGHWWTHEKTSRGKDYYQEGSHVYDELNVLEAFRKALTTWARWVDANVNPMKSMVLFRGYSESHFSGGQWNSGGACDSEVEPIKNVTYLREYNPKMTVLEKVLKGMKTHVTYLNITRMTDFRKDGHPSIYRKQNLPEEERRSPLRFQDCSHWCLPGVPDAWNEILYTELLMKEKHLLVSQKRHR